MNNTVKESLLEQGYKSCGIESDGSELFARKTRINKIDVIQYNWVKNNSLISIASYYIACSTLDKLNNL